LKAPPTPSHTPGYPPGIPAFAFFRFIALLAVSAAFLSHGLALRRASAGADGGSGPPAASGGQRQPAPRWPRHASKPRPADSPPHPPPPTWIAEWDTAEAKFASRVACAGDVNADGCADILICEPGYNKNAGRVLAYYGSPSGLPAKPSWEAADPSGGGYFGVRAEGVGDVDQDGFDDVLVLSQAGAAAPAASDAAYLYRGSPSGLLPAPGWKISANQLGVTSFYLAGRAGDVNGDGFGDLYLFAIINQPDGQSYRLFLFHGSLTGPKTTPDAQWDLADIPSPQGLCIACAGDVNGDGCDDLILGVAKWSGFSKEGGRVLVYHGSPAGLQPAPAWSARYDWPVQKDVDESYEQHFGWSVASAGDVNGDGFADVIVGAPYADHGDLNEGLAFVYHGSRAGLSLKPQWVGESNHAHALLGFSVSGAGDINGDGFDDAIVGVPYATDGQYNEGAAVVFNGSRQGLSRQPSWIVESDNTQQFMGKQVTFAGDVNGDGYDDVLVAAPDFARKGRNFGRAYVYYGGAQGLPDPFHWSLEKPLLVAIQQRMDRVPEFAKLGILISFLAFSLFLFAAWRRALARMRLAERQLVRNQERERLARDVHDHLGAQLSQIALQSELAKATASQPAESGRFLNQIAHTARSALNSIGDLVWRLDPANDKLENFTARLEQLARQALLVPGMALHLDLPEVLPEATLSSNARAELVFMFAEVLRNILQHSGATRVTVKMRALPDQTLCLKIIDNGRGFNPAANADPSAGRSVNSGHGLRNLRARAASLGGRIQIESTLGQNTMVTITVPLEGHGNGRI
jgi:signal transduction histidine kinase